MTEPTWKQRRTECATEELEAWISKSTESLVADFSPTSVAPRRQFPPCIGCGRPVGNSEGDALLVDMNAQTAMFKPCGCVLSITTPAGARSLPLSS